MDKNLLEMLTKTRRDLHQIPELGFDLPKTSAYVQNALRSMGYAPIVMAQSAVIAVKQGIHDEAIAFRADMDALMVLEQTGKDYASTHLGQMHACGHDAHMAMLLGFAQKVADKPPFKHTLVFVFQPAEEGPGGAKVLVEEGLIERFKIAQIYGIHVFPGLDEGIIGLADGPMMAQSLELDITIHGKSAHAAEPDQGIDAIVAAGQLISAYQTIVSRNVDPLETAVVTIGTIQGGEAPNIIAKTVHLTGTARGFHPEVMALLRQRILDINEGIAKANGCTIDAILTDTYPAVINDSALFSALKNHLTCPIAIVKPKMFAEDFSYYQQKVPGLFAMLGTRNEALKLTHPIHSAQFDLNEKALMAGVDFYTQVLSIMD